jgi:hypothetical protein
VGVRRALVGELAGSIAVGARVARLRTARGVRNPHDDAVNERARELRRRQIAEPPSDDDEHVLRGVGNVGGLDAEPAQRAPDERKMSLVELVEGR